MSSHDRQPEPALRGRRQFCAMLAGSLVIPSLAWANKTRTEAVLYASVGPEFTLYRIEAGSLALSKNASVILPANVQYVWPHPSKKLLYVAYSDRAGGSAGNVHGVALLRVDERTGEAESFGETLQLDNRPINITVNRSGTNLLIAFNDPSRLDVYEINADGSLGAQVKQKQFIDPGIYAHQIRVAPSDQTAILVTRGNDPASGHPEDPGAIKAFDLHDGQLTNEQSIAPGSGYGFGPRHVDFHPSGPWMYASMERENQLQVFSLRNGRLSAAPLFVKTTLLEPAKVRPGQVAGPIHVSRDGRFVYLANRSDGTADFEGKKVYVGGENSIVVFRIDPQTGEPTLIQRMPTQSFHARTFALHPDGKILITASVAPMLVRDGDTIETVAAALTVFRVQDNGTLTFVRKYDVDTSAGPMFWVGMMALGNGWPTNTA